MDGDPGQLRRSRQRDCRRGARLRHPLGRPIVRPGVQVDECDSCGAVVHDNRGADRRHDHPHRHPSVRPEYRLHHDGRIRAAEHPEDAGWRRHVGGRDRRRHHRSSGGSGQRPGDRSGQPGHDLCGHGSRRLREPRRRRPLGASAGWSRQRVCRRAVLDGIDAGGRDARPRHVRRRHPAAGRARGGAVSGDDRFRHRRNRLARCAAARHGDQHGFCGARLL